LRTRAAKPSYRENPDEVSRTNRRRTTSDLPMPLDAMQVRVPEPAPVPAPARRSSRRSSMASTMSSAPTEAVEEVPPVPAITTTTNGMQPPAIPAVALGTAPPKKTRAPPKLKATTIPASAPASPVAVFKKQPPPPQYRQSAAQPAGAQSPTPGSAAPLSDAMSPNSEMDALTKGLKKVTLKLGTREEHDRKMKEKLDSDRRARALKGAETRRINKAARDAELSKSKLTPAQRAKLGPEAARVAEASNSRSAPAQQPQPQPVPDTTRTAELWRRHRHLYLWLRTRCL
jgi:histone deacetylase HOS3